MATFIIIIIILNSHRYDISKQGKTMILTTNILDLKSDKEICNIETSVTSVNTYFIAQN